MTVPDPQKRRHNLIKTSSNKRRNFNINWWFLLFWDKEFSLLARNYLFINQKWIWSSYCNWMIRLYFKISSTDSCKFFPHQFWLVAFHWSLKDNKSVRSPGIFKVLKQILTLLGLDGLDFSSGLQSTQSFVQVLEDCSKGFSYDWYHCPLHVPQFVFCFCFFWGGRVRFLARAR